MHQPLATSTIASVFADGVTSRGGQVSDTYDDGGRLFCRSRLPMVAEARPGDRMQGGLALRADDKDVWLHPYLYREVCKNGAIMAHSLDSHRVEFSEFASEDEAVRALDYAIAACSEEEVFQQSIDEVRASFSSGIDHALNLLPLLSHLRGRMAQRVIDMILRRFDDEGERTHYGLMNAITSVARDTRDPDERWRLEELGGGVGALVLPVAPSGAEGARLPMGV